MPGPEQSVNKTGSKKEEQVQKKEQTGFGSEPGRSAGTFFRILRFPLSRIMLAVLVLAVGYFSCSALLKPLTRIMRPEEIIGRPIRAILTAIALIYLYRLLFTFYEKRKVTELSLSYLRREALLGLVGGMIMITGAVSVLSLLGFFRILACEFSVVKILAGFSVIFTLAAAEEIVFRGVIFRITEEWLGTNPALLVSALLFGLAHLPTSGANLLSVISAVSGGIMLCLAFSLTKRLWLPIFLHAGWNFAQVFFGLTVSGISEFTWYSPLQSRLHGPELLSGGKFGIENSIVVIAILTAVCIALNIMRIRSQKKAYHWCQVSHVITS